jgi:hypothetical protein
MKLFKTLAAAAALAALASSALAGGHRYSCNRHQHHHVTPCSGEKLYADLQDTVISDFQTVGQGSSANPAWIDTGLGVTTAKSKCSNGFVARLDARSIIAIATIGSTESTGGLVDKAVTGRSVEAQVALYVDGVPVTLSDGTQAADLDVFVDGQVMESFTPTLDLYALTLKTGGYRSVPWVVPGVDMGQPHQVEVYARVVSTLDASQAQFNSNASASVVNGTLTVDPSQIVTN